MDFIPLIWLILGVVIMGLEFVIPGFVVFFFGVGALLVAGLSWLVPGLKDNIFLQILIWLASSGLTLGFFRKYFASIFKGKVIKDKGEDEFVMQRATVTEEIKKNKYGRVTFQGTSWKAISYDENIGVGDQVEIMKKDNLTLVVKKIYEIED
ncbi:MAG: NfeD family protein [Spirochaetales bacterium]|nr:NfeD family protein [Spirochaetales bacterium]